MDGALKEIFFAPWQEHDCELEEKVPEQEEHEEQEEQEVQEEVDAEATYQHVARACSSAFAEDLVKELLNEAQHPQGPEPEVPAVPWPVMESHEPLARRFAFE